MIFIQHYDSPLGGILLAADETGLTGLWFEGQKFFARDLPAERVACPFGSQTLAGYLLYR